MIGRCKYPYMFGFEYNGAIGIKVCKKWEDSFKAFLDDVGNRPSKKHALKRINAALDYMPGNCAWVLQKRDVERYRARNAAWVAANSHHVKERYKQWYAANFDRVKHNSREYAKKNADRVRANHKAWDDAHPEERRAVVRNRRARQKAATGKHSADDIRDILKAQGNRCGYCRERLSKSSRHVDHIIAISRGGSNDRRNLQILCSTCNVKKGAKDPLDFARSIGRLI